MANFYFIEVKRFGKNGLSSNLFRGNNVRYNVTKFDFFHEMKQFIGDRSKIMH